MKEHDLCFICFHHIKKLSVFVNKNLWKIYEQLSGIKLEEACGVCSLCHSHLRHAQQLFLLAARTGHLHNFTESDELQIEEKLTFLEQSDVLTYSVPKYADQIIEVSEDSNTIPGTGTSEKICVNDHDSKIFCKKTLKPFSNAESNAVLRSECLYIMDKPENFKDSFPELPLQNDPLRTPNIPLESSHALSEFLEDPLLETSNLKNRHPPPKRKKYSRKAKYSCEHCEMKFSVKLKIMQHYNQVHKQRTFICPLCGMNCKRRARLQDHMRVHTGEKPHTCDYCEQRFIALATLKRHILVTHRNHKPYVCPTCNKAFFDRSALRVHLRWHSGERPFACDCGTRFATASARNMHHRTGAHARMQRRGCHGRTSRLTCSCGRIFQTEQGMHLHQIHKSCPRTALPSPPGPQCHRCHCGKEFNSRRRLMSHMRVHLMFEVGKFPCPVCGNTYTCADLLATHLLLHPFSRNCVGCRTTCANREDLRLHIRQFHSNPSVV